MKHAILALRLASMLLLAIVLLFPPCAILKTTADTPGYAANYGVSPNAVYTDITIKTQTTWFFAPPKNATIDPGALLHRLALAAAPALLSLFLQRRA